MATITLSPELSERVERAARDQGTDGRALAETLLDQILSLETEDLRRTIERANAEMEAGGGMDFEEYAREQRAAVEARRRAREGKA